MFVTLAVIAGIAVGIVDAIVIRRTKQFTKAFFIMLIDAGISNILALSVSDVISMYNTGASVFPIESQLLRFQYIYFATVLICGFAKVMLSGIYDGVFFIKKEDASVKKRIPLKINNPGNRQITSNTPAAFKYHREPKRIRSVSKFV